MPLRKLKSLANLGHHAMPNTAKTTASKKRKCDHDDGKENTAPKSSSIEQKPSQCDENASILRDACHADHDHLPINIITTPMTAREQSCLKSRESQNSGSREAEGELMLTDAALIDEEEDMILMVEPKPGLEDDKDLDSESEEEREEKEKQGSWEERKSPMEVVSADALEKLNLILHPPSTLNGKKHGYKPSKITNIWSKRLLEEIKTFLILYTREDSTYKGRWNAASAQAVRSHGRKPGHARRLRAYTRQFIETHEVLMKLVIYWRQRNRIKTEKSRVLSQAGLGPNAN
ncbi:hypothetical protein H0H92_011048 [Tricholoma furcatifolium]|nr:hypothetical protein H0H92_011048 [Tricholoma furcatifolium]